MSTASLVSFRETTLPNGLRIAAEVVPDAYTASFGYFVRSGARDETDLESGLSHFLEHMVFKGTATRTAAQVNRELDELGGQSNAYTSEEKTVYYGTVLPKYQRRKVELLTDLMQPTLRTEDFETERLVILEEIAKYDDQPPFGAFERSMEQRYGVAGLGRRVLGTNESIEAMTPERMRGYFQARYRPGNMVFAAAGNVDFTQLVDQLATLTEHWTSEPVEATLRHPAPAAPPRAASYPPVQPLDTAMCYVVRHYDGPDLTDDDRHAMRILSSILGDEDSSRLFWELIDSGRADVATAWNQEYLDSGLLTFYLACAPDDLESNLRLADEVFERVAADGVEEGELRQAINKTVASLIMRSDRPTSRMFAVGDAWLMTGRYEDLDQTIACYQAVDAAAIDRVIKRFGLKPVVEVHSGG